MDTPPEKFILQYIKKKKRKTNPTWQDINELKHAHEKMILSIHEDGDGPDFYEKALDRIRYTFEKIGVMVSFVHPDYPDTIAIGFSLCNLHADKFDYQKANVPNVFVEADGFGKHIAFGRAAEWGGPVTDLNKDHKVPASIQQTFLNFIDRSHRYYKDKDLPAWIQLYLKR